MITRTVLFLTVFAALQLGWQYGSGSEVGRRVIEGGVVAPAAAVIGVLTPVLGVRAEGNALRASDGGLRVVNGCDGMDALLLLAAGIVVAPLSLRARLGALAAGVPLVYALNLLRILALFYARRAGPAAFDLWHSLLGPVLMVIAILGYFHVWIERWTPDIARRH